MKLLTKAIEKTLPKFYETEYVPVNDKEIKVKFFNPTGQGTWYACEYDPEQKMFYGYVELFEGEWGCFSLEELESVKLPWGMSIERDLHFTPCKFSELNL